MADGIHRNKSDLVSAFAYMLHMKLGFDRLAVSKEKSFEK